MLLIAARRRKFPPVAAGSSNLSAAEEARLAEILRRDTAGAGERLFSLSKQLK
jgi:hypothetical protein